THLQEAEPVLRNADSWCEFGHITRTHGVLRVSALDADHGDRRAGNPWVSRSEDLPVYPSSRRLFDAYGVMRLRADFAEALPLQPLWRTTTLPAGDVLARHVNPE